MYASNLKLGTQNKIMKKDALKEIFDIDPELAEHMPIWFQKMRDAWLKRYAEERLRPKSRNLRYFVKKRIG